jgi:hypothetical protein
MRSCGVTTTLAAPPGASLALAYQQLVNPGLWDRLTARVRRSLEFQLQFGKLDETEQIAWAERIMNETLGFLQFCATSPVQGFAPSELVDIGWHTFILYTREYAAFCEEIAGRFIHHAPNDVPGISSVGQGPTATTQAMLEVGIAVDTELWSGTADCNCTHTPCRRPRCNACGPRCR